MKIPHFYAIVWHNPPDLSTREVRSFPNRILRDDFIQAGPPGGPGWRIPVRAAEAAGVRGSKSDLKP